MEVTVDKSEPLKARISFSVQPDEFEREVQDLLRQMGRQTRMKGFRPGKVPPKVIERTHGKAAREEAKTRFLQRAYEKALTENELRPLAHPHVHVEEIEVLAGGGFSHDFEVRLRPEVKLGEYKGLTYEAQLPEITDEEVEAAIDRACQQNARPEPAGEEGLPEDGMALCKVVLEHQGEVVFERDGLRLGPNMPLPGLDPEAYRQALTGATDGAEVELPITFPEDFEKEQLRGQEGVCRVTVAQAFKVVIPGRDELIAHLEGVEDEAGLLAKARESLEEARAREERHQQEAEVLAKVIDAHEVELPDGMVDDQVEARMRSLRTELAGQGLDEARIEEEVSSQQGELRHQATRGAKAYFLVEAIAEEEGLKVTGQELEDEFRTIAQRNQTDVEEVKKYYREQNLISQLALEIVERKVRAFLWEAASPVAPGGA